MSEQVVLVAIGLAVAAGILWPVIRGRSTKADPVPGVSPETSEELAELELDRSMGRVSEEDYARFLRELEARAPIAATGQDMPADARATAEELVRRWREAPRPTCATCGLRPEPEAVFCSTCGARIGA